MQCASEKPEVVCGYVYFLFNLYCVCFPLLFHLWICGFSIKLTFCLFSSQTGPWRANCVCQSKLLSGRLLSHLQAWQTRGEWSECLIIKNAERIYLGRPRIGGAVGVTLQNVIRLVRARVKPYACGLATGDRNRNHSYTSQRLPKLQGRLWQNPFVVCVYPQNVSDTDF